MREPYIPRYCVGISVEDGNKSIIEEGFNTPKIKHIISTLESVIEKLKEMDDE